MLGVFCICAAPDLVSGHQEDHHVGRVREIGTGTGIVGTGTEGIGTGGRGRGTDGRDAAAHLAAAVQVLDAEPHPLGDASPLPAGNDPHYQGDEERRTGEDSHRHHRERDL